MTETVSFARGLYADAGAIADAPDYARRLVGDGGVNAFVVRTGFDPGAVTPRLDDAVAVLRTLPVRLLFLVGTWWGEGLEPAPGWRMRPAARASGFKPGPAHEARWPMLAPGPETSEAIGQRMSELCRRFAPEGICLTHARFHHAADMPGLWATGETPSFSKRMDAAALTAEKLMQAFMAAETRLAAMSAESVVAAADCGELGLFLDGLAESDVFTRWFDLRCEIVAGTVGELLEPLRAAFPRIEFGANAVGPLFSRASGQDYTRLAAEIDFIQPLLGYVEWHVAQTVRQWARWLRCAAPQLSETNAVRAAGALFGLGADESAPLAQETAGEGSPEFVSAIVRRQIGACERSGGFRRESIHPVLRGKEWPVEIATDAEHALHAAGFGGVFYQGSAGLGGPAPVPGWN